MSKHNVSVNTDGYDSPVLQIHCNPNNCTCHEPYDTSEAKGKKSVPFPFKSEKQSTFIAAADNCKLLPDPKITSGNLESTLSVVENVQVIPILPPRQHGPHCALEISLLEKHAEGCARKKVGLEGRNLIDDSIGSYNVVGRIVYRTCSDESDALKGSAKSFKLNDPTYFGKDLKVQRSKVETYPILSNDENCTVMRANTINNPVANSIFAPQPTTSNKLNQFTLSNVTDDQEPVDSLSPKRSNDVLEVLSVYIRTDNGEEVPDGFHKMHYRGDSCKLHDPTERSKQILALQKLINETSSGAELARSHKAFVSGTQIMAAVGSPVKMPKTVYTPQVNLEDSEESMVSYGKVKPKRTKEPEPYTDSFDMLPQHRATQQNEKVQRPGLFACFRRSRPRKPSESYSDDERNDGGKRVTHSSNQPRRHTGQLQDDYNQHRAAPQYTSRKH